MCVWGGGGGDFEHQRGDGSDFIVKICCRLTSQLEGGGGDKGGGRQWAF